MRHAIGTRAGRVICAALLALSFNAQAQDLRTQGVEMRQVTRESALPETVRRDAIVRAHVTPAGCATIAVYGVVGATITLYDMQLRAVGAVSRAELAGVRSALLCVTEPDHARIEIDQGTRLVLRTVLQRTNPRTRAARRTAPRPPVTERPAPPVVIAPAPSAGAGAGPAPEMQTRSMEMRAAERTLSPVLVELLPDQERAPRQGGSAAPLLANPLTSVGANKNTLLCEALFQLFDQASFAEAQRGVRRDIEGGLELLRPIYWLTRAPLGAAAGAQPGPEACAQRIGTFDYPRAGRVQRKLGLMGAGPYLVVERHDPLENERVAAVIDLSLTPPSQIGAAVAYFRDGFMQAGDVWAPQRFVAQRARSDVIAFMEQSEAPRFAFVPQLLRATRAAGCPLTNLRDICTTP